MPRYAPVLVAISLISIGVAACGPACEVDRYDADSILPLFVVDRPGDDGDLYAEAVVIHPYAGPDEDYEYLRWITMAPTRSLVIDQDDILSEVASADILLVADWHLQRECRLLLAQLLKDNPRGSEQILLLEGLPDGEVFKDLRDGLLWEQVGPRLRLNWPWPLSEYKSVLGVAETLQIPVLGAGLSPPSDIQQQIESLADPVRRGLALTDRTRHMTILSFESTAIKRVVQTLDDAPSSQIVLMIGSGHLTSSRHGSFLRRLEAAAPGKTIVRLHPFDVGVEARAYVRSPRVGRSPLRLPSNSYRWPVYRGPQSTPSVSLASSVCSEDPQVQLKRISDLLRDGETGEAIDATQDLAWDAVSCPTLMRALKSLCDSGSTRERELAVLVLARVQAEWRFVSSRIANIIKTSSSEHVVRNLVRWLATYGDRATPVLNGLLKEPGQSEAVRSRIHRWMSRTREFLQKVSPPGDDG